VSTTDETLDNVDNSFPNTSLWRLKIQCSDSRTYYWVLDGRPDRDNHYFVIHFLHVVLAVATQVRKSVFTRYRRQNAYQLAIQSLVTLPRSRRTVEFDCELTPEVQRVIAFHCSPAAELDVKVIRWTGYGEILVEAMRANRCPARLVVRHMFAARNAFVPALESTTRIEELTVDVQYGLNIEAALIAPGGTGVSVSWWRRRKARSRLVSYERSGSRSCRARQS
jgi:hypothetical protein